MSQPEASIPLLLRHGKTSPNHIKLLFISPAPDITAHDKVDRPARSSRSHCPGTRHLRRSHAIASTSAPQPRSTAESGTKKTRVRLRTELRAMADSGSSPNTSFPKSMSAAVRSRAFCIRLNKKECMSSRQRCNTSRHELSRPSRGSKTSYPHKQTLYMFFSEREADIP